MKELHPNQNVPTRRRALISIVALVLLGAASVTWLAIRPSSALLNQQFTFAGVDVALQSRESSVSETLAEVPSTNQSVEDDDPADVATPDSRDELKVEATIGDLKGVWFQERFGRRTLTIESEKSARMVIEPSELFAFAYGPRIELEFEWQVKDGRAIYRIVGGSPADKVELAKKSWGDRWDEVILEFDPKRFVLLGADGAQSVWTRLENTVTNP